jgi:membrane protease YdiL (CAAX protease family)
MTNHPSSTQEGETPNTKLRTLAWAAVLIASVPQIIYRLFVPVDPGELSVPIWFGWVLVGVLAVLWAATWIWSSLKALRGFLLALITLCAGFFLIIPAIEDSQAWAQYVEPASWGVWLVAKLGIRLVVVALMAATFIGSGIGRRGLFLTRGDPKANAQPTPLLLGIVKEPKPWNRVALEWLPYYVIILLVVVWLQERPDVSQIMQAVIYLPAIFIMAVINAFSEEFEFRSTLMARLEPVLGPQQAIFLTAALFGLQHYFGAPGGPFGVLLAAYLGWWAAKSMIETRGLVWAFSLHFLGDFIIYAFWAMSA